MHRRQSEDTGHSTSSAGRKDLRVGSRIQEAEPRRQDPVTGSCETSNEAESRRQVQEARDRSRGQDQETGQSDKRQPKHEERCSARRQ
jgi:hypothetical protein